VRALERHLTGLVEWLVPEAGMFIWCVVPPRAGSRAHCAGRFKILLPADNPHALDSETLIRQEAYSRGVLALPGTVFIPNNPKTPYVRAAFSLLQDHEVDEALRRLAETIRAAVAHP
jgi:tryptophan aminotransferase